jgi:cytochrome oxidase assembly protein ShyY1
MSKVRQSLTQRRNALVLILLSAAIAACDARATAPAALRPALSKPAAIEGDTLQCKRGWVIVTGTYVCNDES